MLCHRPTLIELYGLEPLVDPSVPAWLEQQQQALRARIASAFESRTPLSTELQASAARANRQRRRRWQRIRRAFIDMAHLVSLTQKLDCDELGEAGIESSEFYAAFERTNHQYLAHD